MKKLLNEWRNYLTEELEQSEEKITKMNFDRIIQSKLSYLDDHGYWSYNDNWEEQYGKKFVDVPKKHAAAVQQTISDAQHAQKKSGGVDNKFIDQNQGRIIVVVLGDSNLVRIRDSHTSETAGNGYNDPKEWSKYGVNNPFCCKNNLRDATSIKEDDYDRMITDLEALGFKQVSLMVPSHLNL